MIPRAHGLRGIAIVLVILFSLLPTYCPNCYVGVDILLVISGFLTAAVLSSVEVLSFKICLQFVFSRAKKILPFYYLIIPGAILCGQFYLNYAFVVKNRFVFSSIALFRNIADMYNGKIANEEIILEATTPTRDILLHTWAVSLELQFCLLAPLIIFMTNLSNKTGNKLVFLLLLATVSCCFDFYLYSPTDRFNSVWSRLWQYLAGWIAFVAFDAKRRSSSELEDLEEPYYLAKCVDFILPCGFVLLLPVSFNPNTLRIFTTVAAAILLYTHSRTSPWILHQFWLREVGHMWLILYLVQWPIISIFRKQGDLQSFQLAIGLIVLVGLLINRFFKPFVRKLSFTKTALLVGFLMPVSMSCYTSTVYFAPLQAFIEEFHLKNVNGVYRSAVTQNMELANVRFSDKLLGCTFNETMPHVLMQHGSPYGICDYDSGFGELRVLVVGNELAVMEASLIKDQFSTNYSDFRVIACPNCQVLYDSDLRNEGLYETVLETIEEFNPDILFITTIFDNVQRSELLTDNIPDDQLINKYISTLRRIENCTSTKIFIQGSLPTFPRYHLANFIVDLADGEEGRQLQKFHKDRKDSDEEMADAEKRLQISACEKCSLFDTRSALMNSDNYFGYDPDTKLSYYDNSGFYSAHALQELEPVFKNLLGAFKPLRDPC